MKTLYYIIAVGMNEWFMAWQMMPLLSLISREISLSFFHRPALLGILVFAYKLYGVHATLCKACVTSLHISDEASKWECHNIHVLIDYMSYD